MGRKNGTHKARIRSRKPSTHVEMSSPNTDNDSEQKAESGLQFYPFAYALYNTHLDDHCWYCLAPAHALRRCLGCGRAMFCNQKCHQLGWKDHKSECSALKTNAPIPDIEVRLLGRIVTRFKAIKNGNDKNDSTFYLHRSSQRSIMEIWAHTDSMREDVFAMNKFNDIYNRLLAFYGSKHMLSKEEIFQLHCRDYINRHAISDDAYLDEIGKGLYLDLCAYDHSCKPNVIYTCSGFVATLRALNSSVNLLDRNTTFYSYIDLLSSVDERRKQLKDTWYFKCECTRCEDNQDHLLTSMLCPCCAQVLCIFGSWPYKDPITQIITCPQCEHVLAKQAVLAAIEAMRFIDRTVHRNQTHQMSKELAVRFLKEIRERFSSILPPVNVYMCKIIQLLIPLTDDNNALLSLHLASEQCVRVCFPSKHPAIAVHLSNIGLLYLRDGHPHRAEYYLEMATDILSFTLGKQHAMTIDKSGLLEQARSEVEQAKQVMLGVQKNESTEA